MNFKGDNKYKIENLLENERKQIENKFINISLFKKSDWYLTGIILLFLTIIILIIPFIPPRYGYSHWNPPKSFLEYFLRIKFCFIITSIIVFISFIYQYLRNKIDLKLNIKYVRKYKITDFYIIGNRKIFLLNGWRLFIINNNNFHFSIKKNKSNILIKRTGTFRLLEYKIY